MTETIEEWRPIAGFFPYEISSLGRVMGKKGIMRPWRHSQGYVSVYLCIGGVKHAKTVHRLVAIAFISNPHKHTDVNHLNGNKTDNDVRNLEWCSRQENSLHARDTGLVPFHSITSIPVVGTCLKTGNELYFSSMMEAEAALSKPKKKSSAINHCFSGKKKSVYGYVWRPV